MKCNKCNEFKRKKINESKKKDIVRSYVRDWRKILLIMFLSSSIYYILASIAVIDITFLSNSFRFSLLILILVTWGFMFITWAKIRPGFLSFAGLMFVVAPVLEFKDPVTSVVFFCLFASLFLLFLEVVLGLVFKIKVTPVERPWCKNKYDSKGRDRR